MRPLHIPVTDGLPDAGAPGQWLGRDRHGAVYTLRWMPQKQCFGALGWSATHPKQPWPQLVLLRGEQEGFIIGHVEGPAIDTRLHGQIRGMRPRIILHDEIHDWAEQEPARLPPPPPPPPERMEVKGGIAQPWLWTVAMLFGLPAVALAIVALVASAPKAGGKPAAPGHTQERTNG